VAANTDVPRLGVSPAAQTAGVIYAANVPADDQIDIQACNVTVGGLNPAEGTFSVILDKTAR
jgi:hypothetical protein